MKSYLPFHAFNSSNLCQIWDLQSWQDPKSLSVPAYITRKENRYWPTNNIDEGRPLYSVSYINTSDQCLILNYDKGLHGLLILKNYDSKLWDIDNGLKNNLFPFPSFLGDINVNISSNQQLISSSLGTVSWFVDILLPKQLILIVIDNKFFNHVHLFM